MSTLFSSESFPPMINYNLIDVQDNDEINENPNAIDDPIVESEPTVIACILWKNGKMGAAYYKLHDQQLYFVQEVIDLQPSFALSAQLMREIEPSHILTIGGKCDLFPKFLKADLSANANSNAASTSVDTAEVPENLSLLKLKEYSYEACEYVVNNVQLLSAPIQAREENQHSHTFIYSLIDVDSKMSVHALGALIKFTEKYWSRFNTKKGAELSFLHIKQVSLADQVLMDKCTFSGLQIFQSCAHEAGFKRWTSSNREGHSVYKIFSQHCKSFIGMRCLRNMLSTPINNMEILKKRLDFIAFVSDPRKEGFTESLQQNMKYMLDVNELFKKIKHGRAAHKHWETLYMVMHHIVNLDKLCSPYRNQCSLLQELSDSISPKLHELLYTINCALDFTTKEMKSRRPIIKFGLDEELDAKKLRRQDIAQSVSAAAAIAVDQLPEFFNECSIVYIPEIGHLIAVKRFGSGCTPQMIDLADFNFMFDLGGIMHYKNPLCVELDRYLGPDLQQDIMAHETRIIDRLAGFVITYNNDIREPLNVIATIDCLISVARVSKERSYVRPHFNNDNIHEIHDGRHPLLEMTCSNFVPNNFRSGNGCSRMKIITGPNDSGKSIYLKQVALIVFLAHVGFYVPAKQANIGIMTGIFSRIQSNESAAISLSAFMLDLTQMSQALHNAKSRSLVVVDEFGRGTDEDDGLALLAAAMQKFLDQGEYCPHVLLSTHFQKIRTLVAPSPLLAYLKMDYKYEGAGNLIFLYKIVAGVSQSFGFEAAAAILGPDLVKRAKELYAMTYNNRPLALVDEEEEFDPTVDIPELDD